MTSTLFENRYVAVCHPISSPKIRTPFVSQVVSFTAWSASALLMVPIFMYASTVEKDSENSCNILWPETETIGACTCATGRDVNATLHMENSVFPRRNKPNSDRQRAGGARAGGLGVGGPGTTGIDGGGTSGLIAGMRETSTTALTLNSRSNASDNRLETTVAVLAPSTTPSTTTVAPSEIAPPVTLAEAHNNGIPAIMVPSTQV
ncbi:hypothetical protein B566_EDAN007933 [Ephemera danica]|nr:hypothetical protein B566_EDAN007933 [Ephemera danica]